MGARWFRSGFGKNPWEPDFPESWVSVGCGFSVGGGASFEPGVTRQGLDSTKGVIGEVNPDAVSRLMKPHLVNIWVVQEVVDGL